MHYTKMTRRQRRASGQQEDEHHGTAGQGVGILLARPFRVGAVAASPDDGASVKLERLEQFGDQAIGGCGVGYVGVDLRVGFRRAEVLDQGQALPGSVLYERDEEIV